MLAKDELTQTEVERILNSQTFRNSEVLRVLLRFLAEKSASGEADHLKEYTIGIDALGKPPTYDPRQDSGVRIQVGRLRQKLVDYYRVEGKDDPVVVDVPKGQFKVTCEPAASRRELAPPIEPLLSLTPPPALPVLSPTYGWRWAAILLGGLLVLTTGWSVYAGIQLAAERRFSGVVRSAWTPELTELWRPMLVPNRPLIVDVATPLFVAFQGVGTFRDSSINSWQEAEESTKIVELRRLLKSPTIAPRYYTAPGEISAVFRLGKILIASPVNVSVARSSQLSQQQMADSNVVFVGSPRVLGEQFRALQAHMEFVVDDRGVQNIHPRPGEPVRLDNHIRVLTGPETNVPDNGDLYVIVTHQPGLLGSGDILSFSANHSPGILAAVEWYTEPNLAKTLLSKLRKPNGEVPRYYQVVFHVIYRDGIPTDVSYVMHRELPSGIR